MDIFNGLDLSSASFHEEVSFGFQEIPNDERCLLEIISSEQKVSRSGDEYISICVQPVESYTNVKMYDGFHFKNTGKNADVTISIAEAKLKSILQANGKEVKDLSGGAEALLKFRFWGIVGVDEEKDKYRNYIKRYLKDPVVADQTTHGNSVVPF